MKSIKELIESKPSNALQVMVDGLLEQSKRKDFKIQMSIFGDTVSDICYGCAATCAVQKLAGVNFTPDIICGANLRANACGFNMRELREFENSIDHARAGCMERIFSFCHLDYSEEYEERFFLTTNNWKEKLPKVKELITELKAKGL